VLAHAIAAQSAARDGPDLPFSIDDGGLNGVHVQALALPLHQALEPAIVQVGGRPRNLPLAKDTAWATEVPLRAARLVACHLC